MRWVNEVLPPRPRPRWLLMTMRLSMSSLPGTERTLVAVGTVRLAAMLAAVRADVPRSRTTSASGAGGAGWAAAAGAGGDGAAGGVGWAAGAVPAEEGTPAVEAGTAAEPGLAAGAGRAAEPGLVV